MKARNPILLDNDVLLKLSCYQLSPHVISSVCKNQAVAVLGAAKFVISRAISKRNFGSKAQAFESLYQLLHACSINEPTEDELALAATLEDFAQANSLDLDTGESQLLAMLIHGSGDVFLTGDKRAIRAIENISCNLGYSARVSHRVACLEQLIMLLIRKHSSNSIQTRVCSEAWVDKSLAICFSCATGIVNESEVANALKSYITDLRKSAGDVLTTCDDLSTVIP